MTMYMSDADISLSHTTGTLVTLAYLQKGSILRWGVPKKLFIIYFVQYSGC